MLYALLTAITLLAFAANSLLCRTALGSGLIDPVSFSTLRLVSGAMVLVPLARLTGSSKAKGTGSWLSSAALFVYAIAFSLAYVSLDAGMGALILFAAVQATMIGMGLKSGEQLHPVQWLGLLAALGGLTYLFSPGIAAPDPVGVFLMLAAGVAWGLYSIRGRRAVAPVSSTAANFLHAVPMAAFASLAALPFMHAQPAGIILAVVSGGVTSGLGYVLWYKALGRLRTTQAAVVQLLVPILAAFGGIVFLGERLSVRLVVSSVLILGGVAVAALSRTARRNAAVLPSKT